MSECQRNGPPRIRIMLRFALALTTFAFVSSAHARSVPHDVREDIAAIQGQHAAPLLLLSDVPEVVDALGHWIERTDQPHQARRLPKSGTRSYERIIALERAQLRCGIEVSASWRLEPFGDCTAWTDGPSARGASVPGAQPESERGTKFERTVVLAVNPVIVTGNMVDVAVETRLGRRESLAVSLTSIPLEELGNPAQFAVQGRGYFWGDVDRGMYGLVQADWLSMDNAAVQSIGVAGGLGIKLTLPMGLVLDGHAGLGPGYPYLLHPALASRVGWAF